MAAWALDQLAYNLEQVTNELCSTTALLQGSPDNLDLGWDMLTRQQAIDVVAAKVTAAIPALSASAFTPDSSAAELVVSAHALCMSAYDANLRVTVATMIRLQAKPSLPQSAYKNGAETVVCVWQYMFSFAGRVANWAQLLRYTRLDLTPLHAAFGTLMTWQLGSLRSQTAMLQALTQQRERGEEVSVTWPHEPVTLLSPALHCLLNLTLLPQRDACRALHRLPPSYISTLCCLAVELLGSELCSALKPGPRKDRVDGEFGQFIAMLVRILGSLYMKHDAVLVEHPLNPELLGGAAIAACRLAIIAGHFSRADTTSVVTTLCYLQDGAIMRDQRAPQRSSSRDVQPAFTPPVGPLLSALSAFSLQHPTSLCMAAMAVTNILELHGNAADGARVGSLPDLLSMCTQHLLRFMQMEQQERRQLKQQRRRQALAPLSPSHREDLQQLQVLLIRTMEGFIFTPLQAPRGEGGGGGGGGGMITRVCMLPGNAAVT